MVRFDPQIRREGRPTNVLINTYLTFREVVSELRQKLSLRDRNGSLQTILFSDAIYLASPDIQDVVGGASMIVGGLLSRGVPARAGIAMGEFITLNWTTNSDGIAKGTHFDAQFLGTGVVNSYYAESKGARGIRVIVHPSASSAIQEVFPDSLLWLDDEGNPDGRYEVNYPYFTFWPPMPLRGRDKIVHKVYGDYKRNLRSLRAAAPASLQPRYDLSLVALRRMYAQSKESMAPTYPFPYRFPFPYPNSEADARYFAAPRGGTRKRRTRK